MKPYSVFLTFYTLPDSEPMKAGKTEMTYVPAPGTLIRVKGRTFKVVHSIHTIDVVPAFGQPNAMVALEEIST